MRRDVYAAEKLRLDKVPGVAEARALTGRNHADRKREPYVAADVETMISAEEIAARVDALAKQIESDLEDPDLVVVGVLKGCFIFLADLVRQFSVPHEMDFIAVSSYGSGTTSGAVRLLKDLETDITDRDVLLVEDIVDTGSSLAYIRHNLEIRKPRSLRICALLDKRERRERDIDVDYIGFEIPDKFVVGYGMDYAERYRDLPYVGVALLDGAGEH